MYEPAKDAFLIIVGQGWRMMAAGIIAYGVSVSLNVWIFSRMTANNGRLLPVRGFIAAALSQIVDTLIFITISFYGVRPIADLMLGQMLAKRSEEHTSELQSLMRISYADFCLKKKKK